MTVAELIAKLQEMPGDAEVFSRTYDSLNEMWFRTDEIEVEMDGTDVLVLPY